MGWPASGRDLFRSIAAIFVFAHSRSLWRERRNLGAFFLRFRAFERDGGPDVHPGYAITRPVDYRSLFLPALDRCPKARGVFHRGGVYFNVDLDQSAERVNRRAARLSCSDTIWLVGLLAEMAVVVRRDRVASVGLLVFSRGSHRGPVLSLSLLRSGRDQADE